VWVYEFSTCRSDQNVCWSAVAANCLHAVSIGVVEVGFNVTCFSANCRQGITVLIVATRGHVSFGFRGIEPGFPVSRFGADISHRTFVTMGSSFRLVKIHIRGIGMVLPVPCFVTHCENCSAQTEAQQHSQYRNMLDV
jgi:hypothetical protein